MDMPNINADWNVWDRDNERDGGKIADKIAKGFLSPEKRIEQWSNIHWLPHNSEWSVLDVACGNGNYYMLFAEVYSMNYVGCDMSERMLELARANNPEGTFIHGDAANLPFDDSSFDMVFCSDLLLHVPPKVEAAIVPELCRVADTVAVVHTRSLISPPRIERRDKDGAIVRYEALETDYANMHNIDSNVEMRIRNERPIGMRYGADVFWLFWR